MRKKTFFIQTCFTKTECCYLVSQASQVYLRSIDYVHGTMQKQAHNQQQKEGSWKSEFCLSSLTYYKLELSAFFSEYIVGFDFCRTM